MADVYHPEKTLYQIWPQYNLRHRSYRGFTLVAMATELP